MDINQFRDKFVHAKTSQKKADVIFEAIQHSVEIKNQDLVSKDKLQVLEEKINSHQKSTDFQFKAMRESIDQEFRHIKEDMKHLATKEELAKCYALIESSKNSMIMWVIGMNIALGGLIVGVMIKLLG